MQETDLPVSTSSRGQACRAMAAEGMAVLLAVAKKGAQDCQVDCVGEAQATSQIHIWQGNGGQLFPPSPWTSP